MYSHILKLKDGHKSSSVSRSDKDYWNIKKLVLEKDILKERAPYQADCHGNCSF